jgi:hypothetical protein
VPAWRRCRPQHPPSPSPPLPLQLNEFLADLFSSGDDATIDRVEAQLVACGISYDPEAVGAALAPAPAPTPEAAPRA